MIQSTEINEIAAALCKVQFEIEDAKKDAINPHFKSRYSTLASIYEACRKLLSKNGIAVIQSPSTTEKGEVRITTLLAHTSGQFFKSEFDLRPKDNLPQSMGSAVSYGRRYSLMSMVGIASDDDDGNDATRPTEPRPEPRHEARITPKPAPVSEPPKHISMEQLKRLHTLKSERKWTDEQIKIYMRQRYGVTSSKDLTASDYQSLCSAIQDHADYASAWHMMNVQTKLLGEGDQDL